MNAHDVSGQEIPRRRLIADLNKSIVAGEFCASSLGGSSARSQNFLAAID